MSEEPEVIIPEPTEEELLAEELLTVESQLKAAILEPFTYDGHLYKSEGERIRNMAIAVALKELPNGYEVEWETAELEANGIDSVYVTLDEDGLTGLFMAYFAHYNAAVALADSDKNTRKDKYKP